MHLNLRGKKQHQLLGWLLVRHRPEMAQELLSAYCADVPPPAFTDHSMIFSLHNRFLQLYPFCNISRRTETHRLFIGAMIRLFHPELHVQPAEGLIIKPGFVQKLARVLQQKEANISTMVRQAIFREKIYADFKDSVDLIVTQIQSHGKSQEKENI